MVSQSVGLASLLTVLLVVDPHLPPAGDLAWGAFGGLCGLAGLILFYEALATGVMSVVAPITAVVSGAVPVAVGVALGERPGIMALVGIAVAIPAMVLLGSSDDGPALAHHPGAARRAFLLAVGAGAGFGFFFVALSRAGGDGGLWPVVAARTASVTTLLVITTLTRAWQTVPGAVTPLAAAAGIGDTTANALYLLASQRGLLAEVAVLASLYPASTILLARLVLHERLGRRQWLGVGLAAVAVVAIAA
jgi:drug/metabolite transporter (DMT)-like permease